MKEQELLFYIPCNASFEGWFGERLGVYCKLPKGHTGMHSSKKPPEAG